MNWTPQELALPDLPDGYSWKLVLDTDDRGMKPESKPKTGTRSKEKEPENNVFTELLADRSTRIYMSVQSKKQTKKKVTGKKNK
jgi:glycogen operon protein